MSSAELRQRAVLPLAGSAPVEVDFQRPLRWGLVLVTVAFGGFLAWAVLAPLDAGVVASATVKVSSNRKVVQHLTGGTVEAILVREGDDVRRDQELIRLDATQALSEQGVVSSQYLVTRAVENRLEAERDGFDEIVFDPKLLERYKGDPQLDATIALQQRLFAARRASLAGEIEILRESLVAAQRQVQSLQQVQGARGAQQRYLQDELSGARELAAEGYIPRNRMLELQRDLSEVSANQAQNLNTMAQVRGQAAELKLRILQQEYDFRKEVQAQLTDVQKERRTLADRLQALDYQVRHTVIRSPIDGEVQALAVTTIGGVIQPGAKLMEIVPRGEPLQIDAMVPVQAIDRIEPGLDVKISFPAFNHAQTPTIPGRVLTVSADRLLSDDNERKPYYLAQVEVTPAGMALLGANHIRAGMPASVTIRTGERNLLSYLLKPLLDRVEHSFKEQ